MIILIYLVIWEYMVLCNSRDLGSSNSAKLRDLVILLRIISKRMKNQNAERNKQTKVAWSGT